MLLASKGNCDTNCSAVRGRNFFKKGKVNDVTSKSILFLDRYSSINPLL